MSVNHIFIWNVRGLNMRARRAVVRAFLLQERVSALCLVETKLAVMSQTFATDLMGNEFDYVCLPALGRSGGVCVAWRRDTWAVSDRVCRTFSVTVALAPIESTSCPWSLCAVYGPVRDEFKEEFLNEIRAVKSSAPGPFLICGDFNQIYQAADKNNDRLDYRSMRRFRRLIDDCRLEELYLHGRLFTWSNERRRPTLERIDHAFASQDWIEAFPRHHLRCLSSDCSDHAPLLLELCTDVWAKPRFRFEAFWLRLDGFEDTVKQAWDCHLPQADPCRLLDQKLRRTARALQSWSMQNMGSVRSQLFMAREIIAQLDAAQDHRALNEIELSLRRQLKLATLGLASLARTIARQRSRIRHLEEGDANTKYFHLQACHRGRKNQIPAILHDGIWLSDNGEKSNIIYEYYNDILGKPFLRSHSIQLSGL